MKTKLLCAAIAIAVSANSFGMELYKAKILKHKEWATGNLKVVFKPANKMQAMQSLQNSQQHGIANGSTSVYTNAPGGVFPFLGESFTIEGSNQVSVHNDSQDTHDYNYVFGVCAYTDQDHHVKQCGYYEDEVEVEAGGYVVEEQSPTLTMQYNQVGYYGTEATTYLLNPDGSSQFAQAAGSLTITDDNHNAAKKN